MLVEIIHQQHLELQELFARHQEVLLQGQLDVAEEWLEHFATCLKVHIEIEEGYLFPEFAKIERTTRWDVSLYEKEHEKIKTLLQKVIDDLNWLSEQELTESQMRRNIIALLDKEKSLKGLIEHHGDREEEAMLKELDNAYTDVGDRVESGTETERSRHYKELQIDIKMTWAEVIGLVKNAVGQVCCNNRIS
jgi:uncharacterized protein YaaR (DUF327 family)